MAYGETKDVPVARLIGFEAKEIADGRAIVALTAGKQHANPMGHSMGESFAILLTLRWAWRLPAHSRPANPSQPSN